MTPQNHPLDFLKTRIFWPVRLSGTVYCHKGLLGSPFNRSWFPASTGGPGQASPDWAGALVGVEA
jgi:hypothetical protein